MSEQFVVVVDGPRWWGDPWQMPDGRPPAAKDDAGRAARRAAAEDELRGLHSALERLPEGTAIVHTGARGAAHHTAQWAGTTGHVFAGCPAADTADGETRRNVFIADMAAAFAALTPGSVKALICHAPPDEGGHYLGTVPAIEDTSELATLLATRGVFVKLVHPEAPPVEPEPESPAV